MDDSQEFDRPSKSRRKRDMHALQELGASLVELSPERLARMELPEDLREAVRAAQRMTKHEARRRQMQYIGRLMRVVDPQPIRDALDALNGSSRSQAALQHRLERLRSRLLEDEEVLGEIAAQAPGADLQHLRRLRRNALKEQEAGRPPRSYRELFRELRQLLGE
ncbi:MAG: ribosome biogenesis factor YjgA [Pseudomonadota bacterium]|jgi:ribosome-associated protein